MRKIEAITEDIEIIRQRADAAERITRMRLARSAGEWDDEQRRVEESVNLTNETSYKKADTALRAEIQPMYDLLFTSPDTDTMREIDTVEADNGAFKQRNLYIDGIGRIDVRLGQYSRQYEPNIPKYSILVGDLPEDIAGFNRHEAGTLFELDTNPGAAGEVDLFTGTIDLIRQKESLQTICKAAGIEVAGQN